MVRWVDSLESTLNGLEKMYLCERNSIGGKVFKYKDWGWFEDLFLRMEQFGIRMCEVLSFGFR